MATGINPIGSISTGRLSSISEPRVAPKTAETGEGSFTNAIGQALDALQGLQGQADAAAVDYAAGGSTELHDVMISAEKVSLGFQLTLQVRNKILDAYQEIMRMQV